MPPASTCNYLDALKTQVMERHGSFVAEPDPLALDIALYEAWEEGASRLQWRAQTLVEQVRRAPLAFPPAWTLAGEHLPRAHQTPYFHRPEAPLPDDDRYPRETWEEIRQLVSPDSYARRYRGETAFVGTARQATPGVDPGWRRDKPPCVAWGRGWIDNHSIRNYARVLAIGYTGLRESIEEELAQLDLAAPGTPEKENALDAMRRVCIAGELLGKRWSDAAAAAAARATGEERARLQVMAQRCARVPARGARTFAEAVQSLWLAHILTCGEDSINANSIGRLDQILFPAYEADRQAGRLTHDEATACMAELACKLYLDYDVQTITLGGLNAEGRDATNELSHIILKATEQVGFIRALNVRIHPDTPPAFLAQAAQNILRGGGIPYLFNDACFLPALHERGIALRDARDYAVIGCVELTIPGKANPHAVSGWFNALKVLELTLHGGIDPASGDAVCPCRPLTAMADFAELLAAYRANAELLAKRMVYLCNRGELAQREQGMLPCWSLLTDDCLDRGRDVTNGGALYNYHSICFMGAPTTADALMAVKQLVFEKKTVDAATLLAALRDDFAGREPLRQQLLNGAPKYGNNHPEVDGLAAAVCNHFIDLMDTMQSPLGGRYFVHLFTFKLNLWFGEMTGATPDGRHAGTPLAYSLSPHPGRDLEGLSAVLSSLAALPHRRAGGGSAAILDIDPSLFGGADGLSQLCQIIRAAFRMGVGQLQFNVVTEEQMRQAKACPETHGNLQVRVAGYSQMFKLLPEDLQNHLIARTKHRR